MEVIHFGLESKTHHAATLPDAVSLVLVHFPFVAHPLALFHLGKCTCQRQRRTMVRALPKPSFLGSDKNMHMPSPNPSSHQCSRPFAKLETHGTPHRSPNGSLNVYH